MDSLLDKKFKQIMQKYYNNSIKKNKSTSPFIYKKKKKHKQKSPTLRNNHNPIKLQFHSDFIENKNKQIINYKLIKNKNTFLSPIRSHKRPDINYDDNITLEKYSFMPNNILSDESLFNLTNRKIGIFSLYNNNKNRNHILDKKELNAKYKLNLANVEQNKPQKIKMTKNALLNSLYQKYSAISPKINTFYKTKINLKFSPERNITNTFLLKSLRTNYNKKINLNNDYFDVNKEIIGNNSKIYVNCLLSNKKISTKKILPNNIYKTLENFKEDDSYKRIHNLDKIVNDIHIFSNK